jgi:LCP family protein required for cell wall assembly
MSRYEDPDGTGDYPSAGRGRAGSLTRRRDPGRNGAHDDWSPNRGDQKNGKRRQPGPARARGGRRRGGAPPTGGQRRIHKIMGRHPVLGILAIVATVAVTFLSLAAYGAYRNVYDSIHHITVTSGELGKRPPKLNGSTNILIIGSDSRAGAGRKYGAGIQGARSDTSMLLHVPPTHTGAIVVSFPRDSMVPVLQCDPAGAGHPGQQAQPGVLEQLNWTFSDGGEACLWKTLEQVTHIHIDHFVEVNFEGFRKIVNDVGGVPVCLPYAIKDHASKLNLPAGRSIVQGAQALAFVRERHIGLGSDLQRINRQQIFLASLAQKIKQSSSLTNPARMYTLVHDIASSLTTDSGLTLTDMYAIANSLKGVSTSSLQFITVPVLPYPPNPGSQVEFNLPLADPLFRAIARDNHILKTARKEARKAKSQRVPAVSPGKVNVQVLNATNTAGLAATTAGQLTTRGFKVAGTGNATPATGTVIEYGSASQLPAASTLLKEVAGARLQQVPSLKSGTLNLVLGSSFNGLTSTHKHKKGKKSATALSKSAAYNGVSGSTNICHDSSAFAGPDNPSMFPNG